MSIKFDAGVLTLGPELNFNSVPKIWSEIKKYIADIRVIDLSGLKKFDSSAVALIIECQKQNRQTAIEIHNVPADMLELAKVCGTKDFL